MATDSRTKTKGQRGHGTSAKSAHPRLQELLKGTLNALDYSIYPSLPRSANQAGRGEHMPHIQVYGELQKLAKAETHIAVKLNIGVDGNSTRIRLYRRAL